MLNIKREFKGAWLNEHSRRVGVRSDGLGMIPDLNVVEVNEFEELAASAFDNNIWGILDQGQTIIPVIVDSYGGEVYSLLRMLDTIKAAEAAGATIVTIGKGKQMSCGSVLITAGTKGFRFIQPTSTIMIHEVSSGNRSCKNEEIQASAEETDRLNKILLESLSLFAGKNKGFFKKEIHRNGHADWFINAKEAVTLGLVDHIGEPKITLELALNVKINTK
jgi:ATP-dependent Clp protease protease subunit